MEYCENCFEEELNTYFVDNLGSVFCSEKCFNESFEYRNLNKEQMFITEVNLIQEILNNALIKALKEVYNIDYKDLEDLQDNFSLEHDYYNLLETFESHIKTIININEKEKQEQ